MRAGAVPTTSAINEQNYIDYFEPVLREGQDIYYITFSHKLSATFESMDRAVAALKEKYPDREIRAFLEEVRAHTVVYFVVDDLVYLKRGGRISALTAAFGKMLGIKPMISVMPDGSLQSVGKVKGSKRVFAEFVRIMREHKCNVKDYRIEVLQADCPETGDAFVQTLRQEFGEDIKIDYQVVGPVIAAHCGPGTLGLIFYGDKQA